MARIGSFSIDLIYRAFRLCPSDCSRIESIQEVSPQFVLATAWNNHRIADARERLAEGTEPDPIHVTGLQFPGYPVYYTVVDGMHRTVAARLAGKKMIRAKVGDICCCRPSELMFINNVPWYLQQDGSWQQEFPATPESDQLVDLLLALGVPAYESPYFWVKRFLRRIGSIIS